jgi:hypothetical protein
MTRRVDSVALERVAGVVSPADSCVAGFPAFWCLGILVQKPVTLCGVYGVSN